MMLAGQLVMVETFVKREWVQGTVVPISGLLRAVDTYGMPLVPVDFLNYGPQWMHAAQVRTVEEHAVEALMS